MRPTRSLLPLVFAALAEASGCCCGAHLVGPGEPDSGIPYQIGQGCDCSGNATQNTDCGACGMLAEACDGCHWIDAGNCDEPKSCGDAGCSPKCSVCGGSDGCGGVCQVGTCQGGETCVRGDCCTPSCSACGGSDGCGGICQVGACAAGQACSAGKCSCDPLSCQIGCCSGTSCDPGTSTTACGADGRACQVCTAGQTCFQGGCCTPSCTVCGGEDGCGGICDVGACATGQTCVDGGCTCDANSCATGCCNGVTCEAGTNSVACGAGGELCQTCGTGTTCLDGGCCTPSCGPTSCGSSDGCGGICPDCCYTCNVNADAGSCALGTAPFLTDGGCPTGYASPAPACTPCWSCAAADAFCGAVGDCGPWTTSAYVGADQTCYGCNGWGYGTDANSACYEAQQATLADSATAGGSCPWPSSSWTAQCGFAGESGEPDYYIGAAPVEPGGCIYCDFGCGGGSSACCVPKDFSAAEASQCCSGTLGPCLGGTGTTCCQ